MIIIIIIIIWVSKKKSLHTTLGRFDYSCLTRSSYHEGREGNPLTSLTSSHFCASVQARTWISTIISRDRFCLK